MALSYLDRAWRDGFWQREPVSACQAYMDAYAAGQRRGTEPVRWLVARTLLGTHPQPLRTRLRPAVCGWRRRVRPFTV